MTPAEERAKQDLDRAIGAALTLDDPDLMVSSYVAVIVGESIENPGEIATMFVYPDNTSPHLLAGMAHHLTMHTNGKIRQSMGG